MRSASSSISRSICCCVFAEPLELLANIFLLFLRLSFLQGRLQLLESLVEVVLASSQFTKPIQNLQVLTLLLVLLRRCLPLGFVAVLLVVEFQLFQLLLGSALASAGSCRIAVAVVAGLVSPSCSRAPELEQGLVGRLLR